jgi:septum formation protein
MFDFVYLASQSPRRRQLLEQIGVAHRLLLADGDEDAEAHEAPLERELPAEYVARVTRLKLQAALRRRAARDLPDAPILCADTTVALGRRMLGKPAHAAAAAEMLRRLSGRVQRVLTAVALSHGARCLSITQVSRVRFAALPTAVIDAYVASGEPFGKAGAYAVQGAIAGWIEHVEGSHSGIMGLPLFETRQLLHKAQVRLRI